MSNLPVRQQWFYFGCAPEGSVGHRLCAGLGEAVPNWAYNLNKFDGSLTPSGSYIPDLAVLSRLGGWSYSTLSWHDFTGDTRPGSNAIIFAPGLEITPEEIWVGFRKRFPREFKRYEGRVKILKWDGAIIDG